MYLTNLWFHCCSKNFLGNRVPIWSFLHLPPQSCNKMRRITCHFHCVKSAQMWSFFWSMFSCIQCEYRKKWTRNNSVFEHFPRSVFQFESRTTCHYTINFWFYGRLFYVFQIMVRLNKACIPSSKSTCNTSKLKSGILRFQIVHIVESPLF